MSAALSHYADHAVVFNRDTVYVQPTERLYGKPAGFWVSVDGDDDWPSWCLGEEFCLTHLQFVHRVILRPDANVLWVNTVPKLDDFNENYGVATNYNGRAIGWHQVARDYDGIVIAPYRYSRRFELEWYYGWDCASGCIWSTDAIESLEPALAEYLTGDPP